MSMSNDVNMNDDLESHRRTYRRFVTVFATIILAHFVGGSLVFVGMFSGGGWFAAVIVALIEVAVIGSVWRLMRRSGLPSQA